MFASPSVSLPNTSRRTLPNYHPINASNIAQSIHYLNYELKNRKSIPYKEKIFFSPLNHYGRLWGPPIFVVNGYRASFPGVRRPGPNVEHLPRSCVEVNNEWSCNSTPSLTPNTYLSCLETRKSKVEFVNTKCHDAKEDVAY
jgi:hypothetical protein